MPKAIDLTICVLQIYKKIKTLLKNALNISEFQALKGMTPIVIITVDRVDTRAACCVAGF